MTENFQATIYSPMLCRVMLCYLSGLCLTDCLGYMATMVNINFMLKGTKQCLHASVAIQTPTCACGVFGSFGNEPMQSCSVHHVSLSLSSVSLASALASVYSPPSDSFDHRSFISYKYMQLCP